MTISGVVRCKVFSRCVYGSLEECLKKGLPQLERVYIRAPEVSEEWEPYSLVSLFLVSFLIPSDSPLALAFGSVCVGVRACVRSVC